MEILPSKYQNQSDKLNLSKNEMFFARCAAKSKRYGLLLLDVNPSMIYDKDSNTLMNMDVVVTEQGVVFFKFFDIVKNINVFESFMSVYMQKFYQDMEKLIIGKLLDNKALRVSVDNDQVLKFPVNIVHVFPELKGADVAKLSNKELSEVIKKQCMFAEDFEKLRKNFDDSMDVFLDDSLVQVAATPMTISDDNVNSIIQRFSPYTIPRMGGLDVPITTPGIDFSNLVVDSQNQVVRVFRLDEDQINIVNRISAEQLILACAGSGKSAVLLAKCFRAAEKNPNKQFLIVCKNRNLHALYEWLIDRAGLPVKNIECQTFHALCRKLLRNNGYGNVTNGNQNFDNWVAWVQQLLAQGQLSDRYYGIFIDEVQAFEQEWYRICYDLLEDTKPSGDHLFVICGDLTQTVDKLKKRGKAPWQISDGHYPKYTNKSIRIEKNYRNCEEVNAYVNRYVEKAKKKLAEIDKNYKPQDDLFLRGKSVWKEPGEVKYIKLSYKNAGWEIKKIIDCIREAHDQHNIPYDEIAVLMYYGHYYAQINRWQDSTYELENRLQKTLNLEQIPYSIMFTNDGNSQPWNSFFGTQSSVKLIKFQGTLGLDFRAVIVCGLPPFGEHEKIKKPNWQALSKDPTEYEFKLDATWRAICNLYVACTRAREFLYIIAPESPDDSDFIKLLNDSRY